MTDAAIQALIDAARTSTDDLVTWAEMKAILEGLKGQVSLTDLGAPSTGQIPKWNGSAWALASDGGGSFTVSGTPGTGQVPKWNGTEAVWSTDETTSGGTGVNADATITADRTWIMGNNTITLYNASANSDPALVFQTVLSANNIITHWRVKSPTDDADAPDYGLLSVVTQNALADPAAPDSYNEVAKLGFNPDRVWSSGKNGFWDAWEPHWRTGSATYLERHISVDIADFPGENRLYSILTIPRTSWSDSDIIQIWKGTSYNWKDQSTGSGNDLMTMSKSGTTGMKLTMIGPTTSALIFEVGGTLGNGVSMYTFDNGGTMDLLNNKWARWYFRNTKVNMALATYASNAAAISGGLAVNDFYTDGSGNVKIVT